MDTQMSMVYSHEAKKVIYNIVSDMALGLVPLDVRSFSHLHDYVDANEYLLTVASLGESDWDALMKFCDGISDEVNWWLHRLPAGTDLARIRALRPVI
jgi:hypothetical protein